MAALLRYIKRLKNPIAPSSLSITQRFQHSSRWSDKKKQEVSPNHPVLKNLNYSALVDNTWSYQQWLKDKGRLHGEKLTEKKQILKKAVSMHESYVIQYPFDPQKPILDYQTLRLAYYYDDDNRELMIHGQNCRLCGNFYFKFIGHDCRRAIFLERMICEFHHLPSLDVLKPYIPEGVYLEYMNKIMEFNKMEKKKKKAEEKARALKKRK